MQLSRFFSLDEMTRSDTAAREGIANQPGSGETERLRALCTAVLDPLRESIGQAISVNSGYRSPDLNRRIGGAPSSQHVEGKATDIQTAAMSVLDLFKTIIRLGLPFDQLIYEARNATAKWVHVSHNAGANRGEIRIAQFGPDGRPVAYPLVTVQQALDMVERVSRSALPQALEYLEVGDEPEHVPAAPPAPKKPQAARKAPARKAAKPAVKRRAGKEAQPAPRGAAKKKPAGAGAKKVSAKGTSAKKAATRKAQAGKSAPKKPPSKKAAPKKPPSKKAAPKKAAPKEAAAKKARR